MRPFGPGLQSTAAGGAGGSFHLVRGSAGSPGSLTILTGDVDAGSSDGPTATGQGAQGAQGAKDGSGGSTGTGGANASAGAGAQAATGGRAATGGVSGSGGIRSGGGAPGSVGVLGSGGIVGSGGQPGSGGAVARGTGGMVVVGTGGATGSGGASGTGGASGSGGTIGTSAACQQHILDYDAELQNARMCNANMAKACATLVPQRLAGCGSGCFTTVDKANMLTQIARQWMMDGCTAAPCPIEACVNPVSSICSVVTGLCTDVAL